MLRVPVHDDCFVSTVVKPAFSIRCGRPAGFSVVILLLRLNSLLRKMESNTFLHKIQKNPCLPQKKKLFGCLSFQTILRDYFDD